MKYKAVQNLLTFSRPSECVAKKYSCIVLVVVFWSERSACAALRLCGYRNSNFLISANSKHFSFFTKKIKNRDRGWGSPKYVFTPILILLCLETPCKISEPYDNPFGVKSILGGKRESKRNDAVNSGHLVQ